jgi:hypothetical protein
MTTTKTTTSVATLKQLQDRCFGIDLNQVHYGGKFYRPDETTPTFNMDTFGNPYLCVWDANSKFPPNYWNLCGWNSLTPEIVREIIKLEVGSKKFQDEYRDYGGFRGWVLQREFYQYSFVEGRRPKKYGSNSLYMRFTDACVILDKSKKNIVYVRYALDNDYLNEWLRQTIDPSIPNNYDELHAQKEFEVLITTTTFSTEKVKVVGRSYDECLETMKQNDPMLDTSGQYSGMRTIPHREGIKPIPSSYEEWVSLQEKEVA